MKNKNNLIDKDYRMQIIMDDEAVKRDGEYDVNEMHNAIDAYMESLELIKSDNNWWYGRKGKPNYAHMLSAVELRYKTDWFDKYLTQWNWVCKESLSKTGWVIEDWTNKHGEFNNGEKYRKILQSI